MDFLMMPEGWSGEETAGMQSAADAMGWAALFWAAAFALLALILTLFAVRVVRRRAFWCPGVGGEVGVEFEDRGPLDFRRHDVLTCSAFDHPDEITCGLHRAVERGARPAGLAYARSHGPSGSHIC